MSDGRVIRSYLYFVAVSAAIPGLIVGHWIAYAVGAGIAISWWITASIAGNTILLKTIGARPFNVSKYHEMAKIVTGKRISPKIGPPTMWIVRNMSPMLISIGLSKKSSHLIFTDGFFAHLDDKSQLGLVTREFESISEGLTATHTALATLLWIILLPGRLGNMIIGKNFGEQNLLATILNLMPAFFIGYPVVLMGASKMKVNIVDSDTLRKLDNPDYLPYGLMKLQESILRSPFNCDLSLSGCCIINPNSNDPYQILIRLHPTTPKRIDRLRMKANANRLKLNR